jgi:putative transposase
VPGPLRTEPARDGGRRQAQGASRGSLRAIFAAPDRHSVFGLVSSVAEKWRKQGHEKVAEHLEEHVEDCLACLAFPESHRRRIRTTNGLERFNQEVKRRTRVVRIFPNRQACLRLVTALAVEQSARSGSRGGATWTCESSKSTAAKNGKRRR